MMSLRDKDGPLYNTTKQEAVGDSTKPSALGSLSSTSRQWSSAFKNPRIVRVSRTFGGKDRHSKVCTIKGLRDRRIRLSVPTAIQLYDLQERLGLGQPSKVIDWLIDNTKHDIDKLPPLPIIPGCFDPTQGYGVPFSSTSPYFDASLLSSRKGGININSSIHDSDVDEEDQSIVAKLKYWNNPNAMLRSKQKYHDQGSTSQILAQNLFPIPSTSSNNNSTSMLPSHNPQPTFLSNNSMLNYYHLEPSNISLTQLGSLGLPSHTSSALTPQPSSLPLSSMSQLFLCPPMATTPYFLQNHHNSAHHPHQVENDMRQLNCFPLLSNNLSSSFHNSSGSQMKAFPFSMNHEPHLQQSEEENRQGKES